MVVPSHNWPEIVTTAAKQRTEEIDERFMISLLCRGSCTNPPTCGIFPLLTHLDVTVVTVEGMAATCPRDATSATPFRKKGVFSFLKGGSQLDLDFLQLRVPV